MYIKPGLIIGIGNHSKEYSNTYHNIGILFVEWLIERQKINRNDLKASKENDFFMYWGSKAPILAISNVYMNDSGMAVKSAARIRKLDPEKILVAQDDSDIEIGKFKFSFNRRSAGHKGIDSIIKSLKTRAFWRLRIGIRERARRGHSRPKAGTLVLKKIKTADRKIFLGVFNNIAMILA